MLPLNDLGERLAGISKGGFGLGVLKTPNIKTRVGVRPFVAGSVPPEERKPEVWASAASPEHLAVINVWALSVFEQSGVHQIIKPDAWETFRAVVYGAPILIVQEVAQLLAASEVQSFLLYGEGSAVSHWGSPTPPASVHGAPWRASRRVLW